MKETAIKAQNLTKDVLSGSKKLRILDRISLQVFKGEFLLITGRSGSGKSTLLYQLGLLDNPSSGQIIIKNCDTSRMSEMEKTNFRLNNLGYVFQDYALLPELTALENIVLPLLMLGVPGKEVRSKGLEVMRRLGLEGKENNLPSEMSGGEQQRTSIARAIVNRPEIIFADEPTANLDDKTSLKIIDVFKEINEQGQTIVMVTHEPDIMPGSSRALSIVEGRLQRKPL